MNNDFQHPIPRRAVSSCPTSIGTYVALHLDSVGKILNHVLFLTLAIDILLFFSSFSLSYLPNHLGFNTVWCSFLLASATVGTLLIVNNSRISALSLLAPTEFMIGVATGITIGAAILAGLLSTTYKSVRHCHDGTKYEQETTTTTPTTSSSSTSNSNTKSDPMFETACANSSAMAGIWFWAGLSAWLNVIAAMLLVTARNELSAHYQNHHQHPYEVIGGGSGASSNTLDNTSSMNGNVAFQQHHDFEETFRRQQERILGATQAAAVQSRAASMFVGDYSDIPEVRDSGTLNGATIQTETMSSVTLNSNNTKKKKKGEVAAAQILSV